jgi:hypothetical protein
MVTESAPEGSGTTTAADSLYVPLEALSSDSSHQPSKNRWRVTPPSVTFTGPPPEERAAAALRRLAEADPRTLADR